MQAYHLYHWDFRYYLISHWICCKFISISGTEWNSSLKYLNFFFKKRGKKSINVQANEKGNNFSLWTYLTIQIQIMFKYQQKWSFNVFAPFTKIISLLEKNWINSVTIFKCLSIIFLWTYSGTRSWNILWPMPERKQKKKWINKIIFQ